MPHSSHASPGLPEQACCVTGQGDVHSLLTTQTPFRSSGVRAPDVTVHFLAFPCEFFAGTSSWVVLNADEITHIQVWQSILNTTVGLMIVCTGRTLNKIEYEASLFSLSFFKIYFIYFLYNVLFAYRPEEGARSHFRWL